MRGCNLRSGRFYGALGFLPQAIFYYLPVTRCPWFELCLFWNIYYTATKRLSCFRKNRVPRCICEMRHCWNESGITDWFTPSKFPCFLCWVIIVALPSQRSLMCKRWIISFFESWAPPLNDLWLALCHGCTVLILLLAECFLYAYLRLIRSSQKSDSGLWVLF